jgi:hypothetical protein
MIQELWDAGQLQAIHTYCRQDVIQTYGLFLRIELMRGRLTPHAYQAAWEAAAPFREELADGPGDVQLTSNPMKTSAAASGAGERALQAPPS